MTDETKPCEFCGKVHGKEEEDLDAEKLAKDLLNLVSDFAMKNNIAATPNHLYVMGNALARIGAQLCFEAGELQAKMEPFLRLMQILKASGQQEKEEKLKQQMEKWPQA